MVPETEAVKNATGFFTAVSSPEKKFAHYNF